MDLGIRLSDILFTMFAFLFPFWPFLVLAPAFSKGNVFGKMLVMWALLLLIRIVLLFSPLPTVDFLIHEPINTLIFLFAGGGIILALVVRRMRRSA
jgi:peptidoglycan/LPS O-acetylase OafA/YrhL